MSERRPDGSPTLTYTGTLNALMGSRNIDALAVKTSDVVDIDNIQR